MSYLSDLLGNLLQVAGSTKARRRIWNFQSGPVVTDDPANGRLNIDFAGVGLTVTSVQTADYTASNGDVVRCDPSGGAFAVTLPAADGSGVQQIAIKNVTNDTTTITVTPDGSDTIDGAANQTITTARGALVLVSAPGMTDWMML